MNDLRAQLVTLIVLSNAVKKITVLLFNHRLGYIWNNVLCLIWDQYHSLDNDMVIKKSVKKCLAVLTLHGSSDIWSDHFMLFKCFSWTPIRLWKANRKLNSQFLLSKSFRIDLNMSNPAPIWFQYKTFLFKFFQNPIIYTTTHIHLIVLNSRCTSKCVYFISQEKHHTSEFQVIQYPELQKSYNSPSVWTADTYVQL